MIGLDDPLLAASDGKDRAPDRFVGRRAALRTLRELVDALDSESTGETLTRIGSPRQSHPQGLCVRRGAGDDYLTADGGMGNPP